MTEDSFKKEDLWGWTKAFARFTYRYPWAVILVVLGVVGGMSGWSFGKFGIKFVSDYDYYIWSETEICDKWNAFAQATQDNYYSTTEKDEKTTVFPQQTIPDAYSIFVYERKGKNMITGDAIRSITEMEDKLMADKDFGKYCLKNSLTGQCVGFVSISNTIRMMGLDPMNLNDATVQGIMMAHPEIRYNFFGNESGATATSSSVLRTTFQFGYPLEGYRNLQDNQKEQKSKIGKWAYDWLKPLSGSFEKPFNGIQGYDSVQGVIDIKVNEIVSHEVAWIVGSFAFVFLYAMIHTKSAFLSVTGVIGVALAIPLSYSICFCLVGIRHFDAFNVVVLFLICGVGADSIFIMTDLLRQSEYLNKEISEDIELRFAYTAQQGMTALFSAMITTAVSFLSLCLSYCRIMRFIGMFAFFLLICDFLISDSFYLAILAIYYRYIGWKCKKQIDQKDAFDMEEEDTNEKEVDNSILACFHKGAPYSANESGLNIKKFNVIEKVFHNYVAVFDYHYRLILVVVSIAITVGLGYFSTSMPPKIDNRFLPPDHKMQHGYELLMNDFAQSSNDFSAQFVWGLTGKVGKKFKDLLTHNYFDQPKYYSFSIASEESQQFLYDTTMTLNNNHKNVIISVKSFITYFRDYVISKGYTFPVPKDQFTARMKEFRDELGRIDPITSQALLPGQSDHCSIGFDINSDEIRYCAIKLFLVNQPDKVSTTIRALKDNLERIFAEYSRSQPAEMGTGYVTSREFVTMETQEEFRKQAIKGVGISIGFAVLASFFSTMSISYTIIFGISLVCIVFSILGVLYLMGWEIGINESIMVTIAGGFSTDYFVHTIEGMASAFKLPRLGRVQHSLGVFGLPVTSSFITTVGAAVFLYPTEVLIFAPFATFMILSAVFGTFFGLIFTPAWASIFTPTRSNRLTDCCQKDKD